MDGHSTYDARIRILTTFDQDPEVRVLFFSSVGACGLNLSKASTVIFLVSGFRSTLPTLPSDSYSFSGSTLERPG